MTIPNICYKANSTYERDAIFDELEKMGWAVLEKQDRNELLSIKRSGCERFWTACDMGNDKPAETYYPSPQSFLAAAREALKPKEPFGPFYYSPFEWKPARMFDLGCEFADIALREENAKLKARITELESKAEPKRENPPKIAGRKYRVKKSHGWFTEGQTVTCQTHPISEHFFINEHRVCGIAQMDLLELLPEESWTAEYKKGQDVWVKATVRKAREGCLDVSVFGSPFYSNIYSPSIIKKV